MDKRNGKSRGSDATAAERAARQHSPPLPHGPACCCVGCEDSATLVAVRKRASLGYVVGVGTAAAATADARFLLTTIDALKADVRRGWTMLPGTGAPLSGDIGGPTSDLKVPVPALPGGAIRDLPGIPMLLWCPECRARHVDSGDFVTIKHHTHACQSCGHVWRPALVNTVGVQFLPGFKDGAR